MQQELLDGEISHSEITELNHDKLKHIWEPFLNSKLLRSGVVYARHALDMQKMTKNWVKEFLTEACLRWKCFGLYTGNREFYAFNNKCKRDYIRRSMKGGRVCTFNRYFESKQFDELWSTIEKHLNLYHIEIATVIDEDLEYIATEKKEYETLFIGHESDYCDIDKNELGDFISNKLGKLPFGKDFAEYFIPQCSS